MNLKQIIENNRDDSILTLYGRQLKVTSSQKIYSNIYNKYKKIALKVAEDFKKDYEYRYDILKSIVYVQHDVIELFISSIRSLIDEIRTDLASIKRYDYTVDSIVNELTEQDYIQEFQLVYSKICSQINEINGELYDEMEYREYRKESRGEWEVTTFGGTWEDAIKNQLQADAMNVISGLGHSLVNSIGNAMSKAEAEEKKEKLYTEKLKNEFVEAVYMDCINAHLFLINLLNERDVDINDAIITDSEKEKADRILENYKTMNTDDDTALDMLLEAIEINPFESEIYEMIIDRFGDSNGEVERYSNCYNVDIKEYKEASIITKCKAIIDEIEDEEQLKNKQKELAAFVQECGLVFEESEVYQLYIEKLQNIDLKIRTVDGIVFDKRKDAEIARIELSEITALISDIGQPRYLDSTYEDCLENTLEKLIKYTTSIKDKYIIQVKELLKECDLRYRKVNNIIFTTREEAELARQEKLQIEKIMPDMIGRINKIDEGYENKLIEIKIQITGFETTVKDEYISKIDKRLDEYDVFYRTVNFYTGRKKEFDSREQADIARKEVEFLDSLTKGISSPTKDSLLDYKEEVELAIRNIQDNTITDVSRPYLEKLNVYLEEFNKLYLKTGALFNSKTVEDASKKRFKEKFNFNAMDLSTYDKIDLVWKQVDEFIVKIKMSRKELFMELNPLYTAEMRLNTVDGYALETREGATKAREELVKISEIMGGVTFCECIDLEYESALRNVLEQINVLETIIKTKYIKKLTEELDCFDVRYRTVDGTVFVTREEADMARKEFNSIMKILEGVNPPSKTSMLDYEENIKEKLSTLQSDYSTVVVNKYIAMLQKYLSDFDRLFRKVSLFGDNTREDAAQKRLKTEMSRIKYSSWADVDDAKLLLDDLTKKLGIDRSFVPEYDKMIEEQEIRLKTIDGIYFETREEADVARQEYFSIQELLSDIKPPKQTDLLDYEWKVKEKLKRLSADYTTIIKNKYIDMLDKYLVSFDDVFCRVSMFKKGTRIEAAEAKALKYVKEAKIRTVIDIENTRHQLIELLPRLGLQRNDIVEAEQYLEQKKNEIINGFPSSNGLGKFGKFFKK